jgi:hypothetical protein
MVGIGPRMCQQGENSYSAPEPARKRNSNLLIPLKACLENRHTITEANLLSQV